MADNQAASYALLTNVIATGASGAVELGTNSKTFQAKGNTSAGAGAATIQIQVSNDTTWPWITLGTISLTLGTGETSDGLAMAAGWRYVRANVSAISGTDATVSVNVGI